MLTQLERRPSSVGTSARSPLLNTVSAGDLDLRAASISDMAQVAPIINGYARRGLMLPKATEQLYRTFREFTVAVDAQGAVIGCAGLRVYTPDVAEVCALAVAESAHGHGVGRRLVEALVEQGRALGLRTLFALTLEAGFFHRLGFRTATIDEFPLKVASDCRVCPRRNQCPEITVARDLIINDERSFSNA